MNNPETEKGKEYLVEIRHAYNVPLENGASALVMLSESVEHSPFERWLDLCVEYPHAGEDFISINGEDLKRLLPLLPAIYKFFNIDMRALEWRDDITEFEA